MIRFIRDTPPPSPYKAGMVRDLGAGAEAAFVAAGDAVAYDSASPPGPLSATELTAVRRAVEGLPSLPAPFCDWTGNGVLTLTSANGGGEAVAVDPAVTFEGMPMVRCTLSSGTFIANFELTTAVPVAKLRTLQVPIRFSSNGGFVTGSNDLQLWLYDSTLGKRWQPQIPLATHQPGVTTVINVTAGAANQGWTFSGGPANTSELENELVKRVRIVLAVPAGASGVQVWVGPLRVNTRGPRGVIVWTLDGQYPSQHAYVLPMLESYGIRASLALVGSTIGTGGLMTSAQIDRWYGAGHEAIHHTYDGAKTGGYANVGQWASAAAIQADIETQWALFRSRGWLRGIGYGVHGFSYPFDQSVAATRQAEVAAALRAAGMVAVRKSVPVYQRRQAIARSGWVAPFCVQGAQQLASTTVAADVTAGMDATARDGDLSIITVHESVIDSAVPAGLQVKNGDLETMVAKAAELERRGEVRNLLFSEAMAEVL